MVVEAALAYMLAPYVRWAIGALFMAVLTVIVFDAEGALFGFLGIGATGIAAAAAVNAWRTRKEVQE